MAKWKYSLETMAEKVEREKEELRGATEMSDEFYDIPGRGCEPDKATRDALLFSLKDDILDVLHDEYPNPVRAKEIARTIRHWRNEGQPKYISFPRKKDVNPILWELYRHQVVKHDRQVRWVLKRPPVNQRNNVADVPDNVEVHDNGPEDYGNS